MNLQEDARNPGQFQLVVNVGPKSAVPLNLANNNNNNNNSSTDAGAGPKPSPSTSSLYQTQKPSPPSSPYHDKQGWTDLDAVPPQFLQKIVPDWNLTFSRSDSTASTQSRKLSDIKARIKKRGKGYVVRLMKGSTTDPCEEAEVELGQQSQPATDNEAQELDSSTLRAELDSSQTASITAQDDILERADLFEIGTSEVGTQRVLEGLPASSTVHNTPVERPGRDHLFRSSIAEEGFSDAETLIPDARRMDDYIDDDRTDLESLFRPRSVHLDRSTSISSIVKTPTRGLSVVGPIRRVDKTTRARGKSKISLDLKRSDAQKSLKVRSNRGSVSHVTHGSTLGRSKKPSLNSSMKPGQPSKGSSEGPSSVLQEDDWLEFAQAGDSSRLRHTRRSSTDGQQSSSGAHTKLRLQTNITQDVFSKTSSVTRRKKSPRLSTPKRSLEDSNNSSDSLDDSPTSSIHSEGRSTEGLHEALGNVFKYDTRKTFDRGTHDKQEIPRVVEPLDDEHVGEIQLPSEVEIRSSPAVGRNSTLRFWGLAIGALADKAYEGFTLLRHQYGTETPVAVGHVRVRWTCVGSRQPPRALYCC